MNLKQALLVFAGIFFVAGSLYAQEISWTWMAGEKESYTLNNPRYGEKGVSSPLNSPGYRAGAVTWVDSDGNLFLFGGFGHDLRGYVGVMSDMWRWDGEEWTWIGGPYLAGQEGQYGTQGLQSDNNWPGARRDAASWIDSFGNLWVFGGNGLASSGANGSLNDLWKWDGQVWTWIAGSDLTGQFGIYDDEDDGFGPGGRAGAFAWIDAEDHLWLLGGSGYSETAGVTLLNDFWKWNGVSWVWVSGSKEGSMDSNYGTMGTPAISNHPGARKNGVAWKDCSGNFWMFGGTGKVPSSSTSVPSLNDLWRWDGEMWTWVNGSNDRVTNGNYGIKGEASLSNSPGPRNNSGGWVDSSCNLWLLGGNGYGESNGGYLNDLWKWDGEKWTWMAGDKSANQNSHSGLIDEFSDEFTPGGRHSHLTWYDREGNLILYGGSGYNLFSDLGRLNDVWKWNGEDWAWIGGGALFRQAR